MKLRSSFNADNESINHLLLVRLKTLRVRDGYLAGTAQSRQYM